jgi:hypothetical protein
LISKKLTAERPETMLAVLCGAVNKAHTVSENSLKEYKKSLEKGQVPSKDVLRSVHQLDFIYDGVKYNFTATRSGPNSYTLYLNGSMISISVRPLTDGGLLVLLDGKVRMQNTGDLGFHVGGWRLPMIDTFSMFLLGSHDLLFGRGSGNAPDGRWQDVLTGEGE